MKKKKIFFVVSSLSAGGAQRVFWLLSQGFDKSKYEISIVLFNSGNAFFSMDIPGVNVIDLKTIKASRSFPKLYKLIKEEKPFAVFGTGDHINIVIALVSIFVKIPYIIARPTSIAAEILHYTSPKGRILGKFTKFFYKKFDFIVCQSEEIFDSLYKLYRINKKRMIIIPNPVLIPDIIKCEETRNRLIIVGRLSGEKGHSRLLDIFSKLPDNYSLTIAGDGVLKQEIVDKVQQLQLDERVNVLGQVSNVVELIAAHDVLLVSSYTEGFPNVVLESLSVGVPVVTFKVGGVSKFLKNDFNGYLIDQDDVKGFEEGIVKASQKVWDSKLIKDDIRSRFSVDKVAGMYESLILN